MEQYIKKTVLVAEIERRIEEITQTISLGNKKIQKSGGNRRAELVRFLSFIDTLEVKEVDLEKEEERIWKDFNMAEFRLSKNDLEKIAKHFYSLGLAQKEE